MSSCYYSDIEVWCLTNNSIRREEGLPYYIGKSRQKSVFANCCLYWFARKPSDSGTNYHDIVVLCFDLAKKKLREVSPPSPCGEVVDSYSTLGLLHDSLCILRHSKISGDIGVWVMKENGTNESWMEQLRFPEIMVKFGDPFHYVMLGKTKFWSV